MNSSKLTSLLLLFLTVMFISSCASPEAIDQCVDAETRQGFIWGLIHGFIAPLSFILGIFMDDVTMYAINNNGNWYDFGFLLGIGGFSGGIFKSGKKKR